MGKINSRKLEDLVPEAEILARQLLAICASDTHLIVITSTFRNQEYQDYLYEQGRTRPGKVVTWTHKSKHLLRRAFDFCVVHEGKPVWNVKVDIDEDNKADYLEVGEIGESLGLVWGGRWDKPDYCHFELKEVSV